MRVFIKNDKSPLTLTINDKVSFENSLPGTKKLLVIYIDGLSSFKSESSNLLKDLMPATHDFFKNSEVYENYYGTGEWTLPNYASLMTGHLQNSHGYIYSAKERTQFKNYLSYPIIHEILEKAGYQTQVISAVPYINPNFGFHLGTNNFYFSKNMNSRDLLNIYLSKEVQSNTTHITWLHFMDIHHRLRGSVDKFQLPNSNIIEQLENNYRFSKKDAENFISRAQNLDSSLVKLYEIESTGMYENIILVSDHGSARLNTAWSSCLDDARTKTTLIVKKKNQSKEVFVKEFTTHLSFKKVVFELLNVETYNQGFEFLKDYAIIQSIYSGKPYRFRIKGPDMEINFEGHNARSFRPYVNPGDIDELISNPGLKIYNAEQKLKIKNLLLGG
jgi:hypothetical protein